MGDVAMLLPTLYGLAKANPEHEFTFLTQAFLANLLISPPSNLEVMVIDIKGEERYIWGLLRYADRLVEEQFDMYIDLHDVLRTKILRWALRMRGIATFCIKKPRALRKQLIAPEGKKDFSRRITMLHVHRDALNRAGLVLPDSYTPLSVDDLPVSAVLRREYPEVFEGNHVIGIAPFASTWSKTYDLDYMEQVVSILTGAGLYVYLLGGGAKEVETLKSWADRHPNTRSIAGKLDLSDELIIISKLRLVVSMDSANMHLASMLGVQVVSIWCATHPFAGFVGWGQKDEDCLQDSDMGCRPCSIFGQVRKCLKGDMPCRRSIAPEVVGAHILKQIKDKEYE